MGRPRKRNAMGSEPSLAFIDPTDQRADPPELVLSCIESAEATLGQITPGFRRFMLTKGQFSMIHLLHAILRQTGRANVVISTWTAGIRDAEQVAFLKESQLIADLRFLIDAGIDQRSPHAHAIERALNRECVTACKTHAKFMMVANEHWRIVCHGSLNLNTNLRWENIDVEDNPALWDFMSLVVQELAELTPPGMVIPHNVPGGIFKTAGEHHPNRVHELGALERRDLIDKSSTPAEHKAEQYAALGYSLSETEIRLGAPLDEEGRAAYARGAYALEDSIRRGVINRAAAGDEKARTRALKYIDEQRQALSDQERERAKAQAQTQAPQLPFVADSRPWRAD